jgi:hypothetical protein
MLTRRGWAAVPTLSARVAQMRAYLAMAEITKHVFYGAKGSHQILTKIRSKVRRSHRTPT